MRFDSKAERTAAVLSVFRDNVILIVFPGRYIDYNNDNNIVLLSSRMAGAVFEFRLPTRLVPSLTRAQWPDTAAAASDFRNKINIVTALSVAPRTAVVV